ncbi:MAG: sporulation protein YabP [Clostridia bacterium]|nr:sporulation protein YabP [Clostridia bacterium]
MERKPESIKRLRSQAVTLENREMLSVSGVRNVDEFNDTDICLDTDCGILHIDGGGLHITKLNLDDGIVLLEGNICGIVFEEEAEERGGFFSKIFK